MGASNDIQDAKTTDCLPRQSCISRINTVGLLFLIMFVAFVAGFLAGSYSLGLPFKKTNHFPEVSIGYLDDKPATLKTKNVDRLNDHASSTPWSYASVIEKYSNNTLHMSVGRRKRQDGCVRCRRIRARRRPSTRSLRSLYAPLNSQEMTLIYNYLSQSNIVTSDVQTPRLSDNYVLSMHFMPPPKEGALRYIDESGPRPGRYARVVVHRGARVIPDMMEYRVGPLGGRAPVGASQLYTNGEIPYAVRAIDAIEWFRLERVVTRDTEMLNKLFEESFDGASLANRQLSATFTGPQIINGNLREPRFFLVYRLKGMYTQDYLDPVPFSGKVYAPDTNESAWYVHSLYYLNQGPYATAADLFRAYTASVIRRVVLPPGHIKSLYEKAFPTRDRRRQRQYSARPPPRTYEPAGPRYRIMDFSVRWMGWTFELSSDHQRGPSIFDVKYKGIRVIYENALNDIALTYATDMAGQTNTIYADASFGVGDYKKLIPGVDCPEHATRIPTSVWLAVTRSPSSSTGICVFEADGEGPLWRHADFSFVSGLRNNFLVVRAVATVGNYDYIVDYRFFLDGKIQTSVKATGYIQSSFWDEDNFLSGPDKSRSPFGYRVSDYAFGPIHDHTFGFKVDLDVITRSNTFQAIGWKAGDILHALQTQAPILQVPSHFAFNSTRFITWDTLRQEAGLKISYEHPKVWTIVNKSYYNKWGIPRGYRITPMATVSQVLPNSHPAVKGLSFTKYHCAVTKHNESEQFISSTYDTNSYMSPVGGVDKMLNNENIVNEDLVMWLSVGFMHIPTSEDFPMTVANEAGYWISPFNFFDETQSMDMPTYADSIDRTKFDRPPQFYPCLERFVQDCYFCDREV